jgi:hypothetical protein
MDVAAQEKLKTKRYTSSFSTICPSFYEPGSLRMDTSAVGDKAERGRASHIAQLSAASDSVVATEDEIRELEHVAAKLPARVWLAATIGMAERFAYYGTQTLFRKWQKLF